MKKFLAVLLCLPLSGCATMGRTSMTEIVTEPPGAAISVNGSYVGDSPVSVRLPKECVWVGVFNAPGGRRCALVQIHAEPRSSMAGNLYTRTVTVNPREMPSNKILLNLGLEPIRPTQALEVK